MPMVKWRVEPTALCRIGTANIQTRKAPALDFNDVTNFIFANVIRQLSCLCKESQEMFDELHQMASVTVQRTNSLTNRVVALRSMADRLNPTVEEVSLDDVGAYKPYKSKTTKDPSFSLHRPQAIVDVYCSSQPIPALAKLNQFRTDGKDCVKMYTNPEFFFELWSNQITKELIEKKPKRKKRQAQVQAVDTVRMPVNVKMKEMQNKVERQNEAPGPLKPKPTQGMPTSIDSKTVTNSEKPAPDIHRKPSMSEIPPPPPPPGTSTHVPPSPRTSMTPGQRTSTRRPCDPPPPPPPLEDTVGKGSNRYSELPPPPPSPPPPFSPPGPAKVKVQAINGEDELDSLPPPPLLREATKNSKRGTLYSVGDFSRETFFLPPPPPPPQTVPPSPPPTPTPAVAAPPPPPPPPPPPVLLAVPVASSGSILPTPESAFQLRAVGPPVQKRNSRGDLLQAIRVGITLRKVEETKSEEEVKQPTGGLFDVQAILEMRRKVMEEDSDEDEEDGAWDD